MNYSEPLINQVAVFFRALGCGIILGVLYDSVSVIRMLFGERKAVYVFFDTVYFLMASLLSFFFMVLYNSGQVRLNLMLAEAFGGVAFHFSLGKYLVGRFGCYLKRVRKIIIFMLSPLRKVTAKIRSFLGKIFSQLRGRVKERKNIPKNAKKFSDIGKILLKNKNKSV